MERPAWLKWLQEQGLRSDSGDSPELIETHVSWVLLTADRAYKFKKPVDLGFLDFSEARRRRHFCLEELRGNQAFAPDLYLGLVMLQPTADGYQLETLLADEALARDDDSWPADMEPGVLMRRFPPDAELLARLATLKSADLQAFGVELARIHQQQPAASAGAYGAPEQLLAPMNENFKQLRAALGRQASAEELTRLDSLQRWTASRYEALKPLLEARYRDGWIRACHGDLHLGNLYWEDGAVRAFDCIEFDPALRWIDPISDLAFLVMDCLHHKRKDLAFSLLDAYLAESGDYAGAGLLDFYLVYRAMVRAKVAALRLTQSDDEAGRRLARKAFNAHLHLAELWAMHKAPGLLMTCGYSGSGKSWLSKRLVGVLPGVRLCADRERRRLFGMGPVESSGSGLNQGLYSASRTGKVYALLAEHAAALLRAGVHCIVDASFLDGTRRMAFIELAHTCGTPWAIVYAQAPPDVLRQRIEARARAGEDPSEADLTVLEAQLARGHGLNLKYPLVCAVDTAQEMDRERLHDVAAAVRMIWLTQSHTAGH